MKNPELATKFGKILSEYRKLRGMSQEQLASESELDRTYISQLERGKKMPTLQTIIAICQSLDLNPTELIANLTRQTTSQKANPTQKLPIYATKISCGTPLGAQAEADHEVLSLDELLIKNADSTFFVRADGDSMFPTIEDGDYLVIDGRLRPKNNEIILAQTDSEFSIKRFEQTKDKITLRSDNPFYQDLVFRPKTKMSDFQVCGVVTAVIKRFQ